MNSQNPNLVPAPLSFTRGDDYSWSVTITSAGVPVDITGRTYRAQLRETPESPTAVDAAVTTTPLEGKVTMTLTAAQTYTMTPGRWWWDVEQTDTAARKLTFAGGPVTVAADVTRS